MFKIILAYILAFIFLGWVSGLIDALFLPVMIMTSRNKVAPLLSSCLSAISMFLAALLFFWICGKLQVQPVYAMFVLPVLAMLSNDRNRIKNAELGRAQRSLRSMPDEYDPNAVVRMEYGYLIGDIIGLIGALLVRGQLSLY
jgi:hypothetical protein